MPNRYTVSTGQTLSVQDTSESSVSLQIATQKHVDMNFTSSELTLSLDDFSERIIEPAMAVLAANIEADAMNMFLDVYNNVNNIGSAITLAKVWGARKALNDNLAPMDKNRYMLLNTQDNLDFLIDAKGLFHSAAQIEEQYSEGMVGRTGGMNFYENTLIPTSTTGTDASNCTVNGASQTGSTLTIANGSSKTFKKGDIITLGINRVHPETKNDTGVLHPFVVTADAAAGATSLSISPAITTSGASQNVTGSPANGATVTKVGSASGVYKPSVAFHRDAFAFATADLIMPKGVDFAAREVMDGISMRLVRQYDINNDRLPTRLDVLYGYQTLRAQLACRVLSN